MNQTEILAKQTEDAYNWVNKLISSVPKDSRDIIPEQIESSITWQTGHLIMSFYFHSIMVITGHQKDILQKVPVKEYNELFTDASPHKSKGKINPEELEDHLYLVEQKSLEIIRSLSPKDLESNLEPTSFPHPVANNKFEALDWNIKHTMWHCGQTGIIKRIINERFDFGLKKA